MKKFTLILAFILGALLAHVDVFGQSSLYRMKTVTGFGWGQRVVPNAAYLDSTFNSFWLRGGNTVGNNTSYIGTNDNRSFYLKGNNIRGIKIDSLGQTTIGTTTTNLLKVNSDGVYSLGKLGTEGKDQTAFGSLCMPLNTGQENSGFGRGALYLNTTGIENTAIGCLALLSNVTGSVNTALGFHAGFSNLGYRNNYIGSNCAFSNANANQNVVIGTDAMYNATAASSNVIVGNSSYYDGTGNFNTIVGFVTGQSMNNANYNTIIGSQIVGPSPTTNSNILIGDGAGNIRYRYDAANSSNLFPQRVRVGSSTAASATLDVTGTMSVSSTASMGGVLIAQNTFSALTNSFFQNNVKLNNALAPQLALSSANSSIVITTYSNDVNYIDATGQDLYLRNTTSGKGFIFRPNAASSNIISIGTSGTPTLNVSGTMSVSSTATINGVNCGTGNIIGNGTNFTIDNSVFGNLHLKCTTGSAVTLNGGVGAVLSAYSNSIVIAQPLYANSTMSVAGTTTLSNLGTSMIGTVQIAGVLTGTATLDFPSTGAQSNSDLTITVTGAAVGDAVSVGAPATLQDGTSYYGWVSAANTVTIRLNNYSSTSKDPASATFKAIVIKN